jgi:hypothetical protein
VRDTPNSAGNQRSLRSLSTTSSGSTSCKGARRWPRRWECHTTRIRGVLWSECSRGAVMPVGAGFVLE